MKKWKVTVFESLRYVTNYSIEADTAKEAEEKILAGEGDVQSQQMISEESFDREILEKAEELTH